MRTVSEGSLESARAITEQYDRVRQQAEEERRRAAAAMRAIYEQTAGDTHSLFADANERFAETVREMKQMAQEMQQELEATRVQTQRELETMRAQMQRELEATRGDLRRGVFDLPQETAESTAQMRRVIVDQIEALAELNRIVARHGRNLDAVEPVRRGRDEPVLAMAGGRNTDAPSPPPIAAMPPRSDFAARTELPPPPPPARPAQRPPLGNTDIGSFAPARRAEPQAPNPAPPQQTPPAAAGRGWLTDLLNRASREESEPVREFPRDANRDQGRDPVRESLRDLARETNRDTGRDQGRDNGREQPRAAEERTARHSIESLDSLSVDIARMIDHDAAADLWDRYKRGERNVFTRRLYTLQGQQAFDEIRKKYRGDREFKQTVDRYIGEFERLLGRSLARRPQPGGGAHVPHVGNRQGLHHAGPRRRTV